MLPFDPVSEIYPAASLSSVCTLGFGMMKLHIALLGGFSFDATFFIRLMLLSVCLFMCHQ